MSQISIKGLIKYKKQNPALEREGEREGERERENERMNKQTIFFFFY